MSETPPPAPPSPSLEFLVHGQLRQALIVPSSHNQSFEMWVEPTDEMEIFSELVGRQCGATILGNHLWFFRPIEIPVKDGDQTVMMKKMLALDGGCFPEDDLTHMRENGIKIRRHPKNPDPLSGLLIVTAGDVMELPNPITFSKVSFKGGLAKNQAPQDQQAPQEDPVDDQQVEVEQTATSRSRIQVQQSVLGQESGLGTN